jgi:hypothetical protein
VPPAGAAVPLLEHRGRRSSSRRRAQGARAPVSKTTERRDKLEWNTRLLAQGLLTEAGFDVKAGESPIVPVMLYNAKLAQDVARDLFAEGIYVVGFFFPVVPKGRRASGRMRRRASARSSRRPTTQHLDKAIEAFVKVGKKYDILGASPGIDRVGRAVEGDDGNRRPVGLGCAKTSHRCKRRDPVTVASRKLGGEPCAAGESHHEHTRAVGAIAPRRVVHDVEKIANVIRFPILVRHVPGRPCRPGNDGDRKEDDHPALARASGEAADVPLLLRAAPLP